MPQNTPPPADASRNAKDYKSLSRWQVANHFNTEMKKPKPGNQLANFLVKAFLKWIYHTIKSRFGKRHSYVHYPEGISGIYKLNANGEAPGKEIKIGIASDWATDTPESYKVAEKIASHEPDYTIHMGDTYYVGAKPEITKNFLPVDNCPWVRGTKGSFALLGNHEMYAQGDSFFEDLLPSMGIKNDNGLFGGQTAGFFCLENDHWKILGLDTGYHSIGVPLLEVLPWFKGDGKLDDILVAWLKQHVFKDEPVRKGLVILTHHQYITAYKRETEYQKPANQLAEIIGKNRPVIWLWGHEHKFSIFGKVQVGEGITAYGRCIGHGGMPVELNADFKTSDKRQGYSRLVMTDQRPYTNEANLELGFNGYAMLNLKENELRIEYHDINKKLLEETWTASADGTIEGRIQPPDPSLLLRTVTGKNWNDAVK